MLFGLVRESSLLAEHIASLVKKRGAVVARLVLGLLFDARPPPHIRVPVAIGVLRPALVVHPSPIGLDDAELATHFVERGKASDRGHKRRGSRVGELSAGLKVISLGNSTERSLPLRPSAIVEQQGIVLALQRLTGLGANREGVAQHWLHATHRGDAEVGNDWTAYELHDVVDKFGIHSLAVGGLAVFQPRHATSVTIACLASLEGFQRGTIGFLRTDYDYAHGIGSFLVGCWLDCTSHMGLPPSSSHKLKSLGVEGLNLRGDASAEAEAIKKQARGVAPVEHEARQPAESGELLSHISTRSPRPNRLEKLVGLDEVEATRRSPVRKVFVVGFLADRQDARQNQHHLGRVEGRRETAKLDATSRAKLREVDKRILANVNHEGAGVLGSLDFAVLATRGNHGTPARAIPAFRILPIEDRRKAKAKASDFLAPVENVGRGAGATSGTSVDRDVDSSVSLTASADRTLGSDALEEGEEVEDVLKALIATENWGNKLALVVAVEGADRGIGVSLPRLASKHRSLHLLAVGKGHPTNRKATAVMADLEAEVTGNLSFDLDSEGCCFVYHASIMPYPKPLGKYFFSIRA